MYFDNPFLFWTETMNCDFDGGYCTLYEEKHLGGMSWRKGSGGAGLKETGPGRDHTLVYGKSEIRTNFLVM